ncbi:MAG: BatD family protein [Anaerolineae bacterium]|nr:BatD family protein [Anaerolineae bacterium]
MLSCSLFISQAQTPESTSPEFFIEAEVDNYTPYVGQQITYVLKRYQAVDFPNPPHYEDRPFIGFWDTPLMQQPTYTTTLQGREYRVHPTHIALFPTLVGSRTIEPTQLVIPGDGPEADTILESQAITIQVQPLPPNPPDHFRGAVGQFEISAAFDPPEGKINNPMNLVIEVAGSGNINALVGPTTPDIDLWVINMFGSDTVTNVSLSKEVVKGSRRFIWNVIPTEAGQQFFPAIRFSFFNPQSQTYESIRTEPIPITVQADENASPFLSPIAIPQQNIPHRTIDIRHIKRVPNRLMQAGNSTLAFFVYVSGIIIPVVFVATVWRHQAKNNKREKSPQLRRRQAKQQAKERLAKVEVRYATADTLIYQIVSDYLSDEFSTPITGLTTTQLTALLKKGNLPPNLIEQTHNLLTQIEASRFGPTEKSLAARQILLQEANHLIDDLERFFAQR